MASFQYRFVSLAAVLALAACGGGSGDNPVALTGSASPSTNTGLDAPETDDNAREFEPFHEATGRPVEAAQSAPSGQVADHGLRKAAPLSAAAATTPTVDLGAPEPAAFIEMNQNNQLRQSGRLDTMRPMAQQIGIARAVPQLATVAATVAALRWEATTSGGQKASVQLQSDGARQLRIGMRVVQLPDNALVRVQGAQDTQALEVSGSFINQALASNRAADGMSEATQTYWLPGAAGDTATLEIELPAGTAPSLVQVALPQLSHAVDTAVSYAQGLLQAQSNCPGVTPDATCSLGTAANAINASSTYDYVNGGVGYVCSGTLITDKAGTAANFFLTAHHCVSNQTQASTVNAYWFYRSSACGGTTLNPGFQQSAGANYRFGQSVVSGSINNPTGTDTALLQLVGAPPAGAYKAGWLIDRQPVSGTSLSSIHHPASSGAYNTLARRSNGSISSFFNGLIPSGNGIAGVIDSSRVDFPQYVISWTSGITEPGSSGSALFRNPDSATPQVVGQLYGGATTCAAPNNPSVYGRFDLGYEDGMIDWLNPGYRMVFRMYNRVAGVHFYSADVTERNNVRQNLANFTYEGSVYTVASGPGAGSAPVYRFLNRNTGTHFYTISESERASIIANLGNVYSFEGVAWYARTSGDNTAGTIPIYRFFLPSQGTHFYTASADERDSVIANLSGIYQYEGVAYRAWPRY
jgi:hypothetical protein